MAKSITMNMRWVCWLFVLIGILFMGIGVSAYLFASGFESIEEERLFKDVFLGVFGGMGLALAVIGFFVALRMRSAKRLAEKLMSMGTSVWADLVDVTRSRNMQINHYVPCVLRCTYRHSDGQTYMFKSKYLRYSPEKMLADGKVKVWFDPYDIKRYVVDVEGSFRETIIEI